MAKSHIRRRLGFVIFLFLSLILLSACSETKSENRKFTFIEKTDRYDSYRLVFDSEKDQTYYYIDISGWEYDNFEDVTEVEENEVLDLEVRKLKNSDDGWLFGVPKYDCLEIIGECKRLHEFEDFSKEKR